MAVFDTCGCCSLRSGAILVGSVQMIMSVCLSGAGVYLLSIGNLQALLQKAWKKLYFFSGPVLVAENGSAGPLPLLLTTGEILSIEFFILLSSVYLATSGLSNLLLIVGAVRSFSGFLIQWLVLQWITLFGVVGVMGVAFWRLVLASSVARYWWVIVFGLGILILLLIALFFVLSLYQTLRDQEVPECRDDIELLNRQLWRPKHETFYEFD